MVRVHAGGGVRVEYILEGLEAVGHILHRQGATGIHHVDALGTIRLHQLGLLGERCRRGHVRHHQEADRVHTELAGVLNVLFGDVCFGAMRGDPHGAGAGGIGRIQIVYRANPGDQ